MNVLELLVGSVVDYAIFVLDAEGKVVTWNAGAQQLKQYTADEIIGRHFSVFYTPEAQREGVPGEALTHAIEEGRWESEGWRVRKDGSRFWANVVITPLFEDDGTLQGFAKVTRDLSDRKEQEDLLRRLAEREAAAANQLREVDRMRRELATMIAHDLRGPVSVIEKLLDLLLEQWDELDDAAQRERVERARRRAEDLSALTDDVFDLSLIDADALEVADESIELTAIAREVAADANATAGGVDTVRVHDTGAVAARGDARRVHQILTNLVSNATKYAPTGEGVDMVTCLTGAGATVTVHNGGPGIPLADQDRIFDRFVRLAHPDGTSGTGLGLFIARSLAESQGGELTVESGPDGTTFSLLLPADQAATCAP